MTNSLLMVLMLMMGCSAVHAPERPTDVPRTAVWAGGADGGAWIRCDPIAKEPYTEYECTMYHESGGVWASGRFITSERGEHGYEFPAAVVVPQPPKRYESYDGRRIYVRDGRLLVPHGWVEYPFGDGHGKRERYQLGEVVETADF